MTSEPGPRTVDPSLPRTRAPKRPVAERREQLLDAAMRVMRREGVQAATTRAITTEAEVPHGTFHYCFPVKRDFYAALFERELQQRLGTAVMPASGSARDVVRAGLAAFFDGVRADPQRGLVMAELSTSVRSSLELSDLARWEREQYDALVERVAREWLAAQHPDSDVDPGSLARLLIAVGEGVSESWLSTRDDAAAERTLDLAAASIAALFDAR